MRRYEIPGDIAPLEEPATWLRRIATEYGDQMTPAEFELFENAAGEFN
jgi:hypothetical protein